MMCSLDKLPNEGICHVAFVFSGKVDSTFVFPDSSHNHLNSGEGYNQGVSCSIGGGGPLEQQ